MTEDISIQWEVRYVTGSIEAEPRHIENCDSEDDAMDAILDWIHEDASQYIEFRITNINEVVAFIHSVMAEKKNERHA